MTASDLNPSSVDGHDRAWTTDTRPSNLTLGMMGLNTDTGLIEVASADGTVRPLGSVPDGVAGSGTTPGGAGISVSVPGSNGGSKADTGHAAGGAGGSRSYAAGNGGNTASNGTDAGGAGGSFPNTAGNGGNATAGTGNGGAGGSVVNTAGIGGSSAGGSAGIDGGIRNEGLVVNKKTVAAKTVAVTLTGLELRGGMITASQGGAAAANYTLPTGTILQNALPVDFAVGDSFDFSIINISTNAAEIITLVGATGTTIVGNATIAANNATTNQAWGTFRAIKTGANTFNIYRIG